MGFGAIGSGTGGNMLKIDITIMINKLRMMMVDSLSQDICKDALQAWATEGCGKTAIRLINIVKGLCPMQTPERDLAIKICRDISIFIREENYDIDTTCSTSTNRNLLSNQRRSCR
jgi:hypothetical protein